MKLKKILAAVAAAAVAVSAMAVNTFALSTKDYLKDGVVYINADKPEDPTWAIDAGVDQTTVYGVTFHVTFGSADWYGGGIGANSPSTGWKSIEWGTNSKTVTADVEKGTITWLNDAPVFKADDKYAQLWLQIWSGADSMTINSADVLGEGGTVISTDDAPAAPAEEAPAAVEATELWSGSNDLGTDWSGDKALKLDASLFANVADGSTIEIGYTTGDAEYYNLKIVENTDGWPALSSPTDLDPQYQTVSVEKDSTSYSFTVNADDAAKLQANGMVIQGYAVTLTKVAVNGAAAAPTAEEKTAEAAPEAEEDEDVDVDVEPEEEEEEPAAEPVAETEAPAVEEAPAPAVENATAAPATGNTTVAAIAAVMAAAGVAAIAAKKRK